MARFGEINAQYFDDAGAPLGGGKLYFYESGTTTLKNTYADINLTIPNTNPVILTAAGRQPNIFFNGNAKGILVDKNDVQILVRDPVGETGTNFGDPWVATRIYSTNSVVIGSDGVYYRSLANGNQNNNPTTTSGFWTLLYSVQWNAGITYDIGAVVTYDNQQYQSLQTSNLNQNPETQTAYWVGLEFAWIATATYSEDQNVVGTDGILYTSLQNSNIGNDPATSPAYWVGTSAAAAASAVAAAASEAAAAASETAAAASETAAAASETAAAASETAAAASESAAATSETNAANSASAASTSETNAAASETAAAASASAASTSETNAAASASAASTSETNAAASETAAAASETAAAASESAAATSETNAANSASAASTSASNASTSETNAASSATAAASSATAAAGSATAAAGSATAASDKYDEFDARYLGEKASDPSVDNQGGALVEGALYFNTTSDAMKVYDGSSWVNVAPVATSVTVSQISDYTGTATELNYTDGVTSNIQTQLDAKAPLASPTFTGTVTATAFSGDGSALTGVDSLPSQTGNTGKFLTTNGTAAAWDLVDVSSEITGTLPVANGGTGAASLAANNVVLGNGTSPVQVIAPSTAGNVLTSDGTTWASTPAPSAAPTFEATASGSIANGDAVIVNSDGTVSSIVETTGAASVGAEVQLTTANTSYNVSAYHQDQKSVVVFYADADNSSYLTAVVGSAINGFVSWGTPQVVYSNTIGNMYKAVYHAAENVIVLTYLLQSSSTVRLKAFSLLGGLLSGGTEVSANGGSRPTLTYDSTTELIICGYRQIGSPYYGEALTVSVSGTTLTTNTITVISSAFSEYTGLSYDPVQNKTLYVYGELSTGKSEARILTVSGTNISAGSAVQNWMGSGNYPVESVALIYDPQTDQHIAFMSESAGIDGVSVALAISGSSITFGSLYEFESSSTAFVRAAYVPAANKFIVGYTLTSGTNLYGIIASVSGTVISFTGKELLRTSISTNSALDVASFDFLKTAVISYDEASGGEFARTYAPVTFSSNLTSGNYIGISNAAYTNGATATVQIVGSVDDAQSGLSAGQAYYVQSNGTFGNSPDIVSVFGGTAVSATRLIVKG